MLKKRLRFTNPFSVGNSPVLLVSKTSQPPSSQYPKMRQNKILRIALPIGNNVLIANDVPESMGRVNENENRSKIAITADSIEEAGRIFNGLSAGGTVENANGRKSLAYLLRNVQGQVRH